MTPFFLILSLALLLVPTTPAAAQLCNSHSIILAMLADQYDEAPVAIGLANNGGLVEVLTTTDGDRRTGHMKLCIFPAYELREGTCRVHLTPQEGLLMTALLSHREVTTLQFIETLWPHPDLEPDGQYDVLKVQLTNLRKKLNQIGWDVSSRLFPPRGHEKIAKTVTLYGYGWHLEESFREMRLAA